MATKFHNSFTVRLRSRFVIKSPDFKVAATLPTEMFGSALTHNFIQFPRTRWTGR